MPQPKPFFLFFLCHNSLFGEPEPERLQHRQEHPGDPGAAAVAGAGVRVAEVSQHGAAIFVSDNVPTLDIPTNRSVAAAVSAVAAAGGGGAGEEQDDG